MRKILTSILAIALLFAGCKNEALDPLGEWTIDPATITGPDSGATLTLNEANPAQALAFTWNAATTSNQFVVTYTVVIDSADNADFSSPIVSFTPSNAGKDVTASITAQQLDYALSAANYPANANASLKWGVIAKAIEKTAIASAPLTVKRFEHEIEPATLYIAGAGTESGVDITKAMKMRQQKDASGDGTQIFDAYLTLTKDATFKLYDAQQAYSLKWGGNEGTITKGGSAIKFDGETGQYRVTVNLNDKTYAFMKIDMWSLVGDGITEGWGGDHPLDYKGNGLWQGTVDLIKPSETASLIFRANGDWGYIIKHIIGSNAVLMESEAGDAGVSVDNIPVSKPGSFIVSLNLAADQYVYSIEKDPNGPVSIDAPDELYLLSNGSVVKQLTKADQVFTTDVWLPLSADKTYTLNSKSDGTGTGYSMTASFGDTDSPTSDNVTGNVNLNDNTDPIAVSTTQAYNITVNFETAKVSWKYYNMKMFHWDDPNGGWDARNEYAMTYVGDYKFEVTAAITANYDIKFNSPWDVQFGDATGGLSGTMTNSGSSANFTGIGSSGTYKATIVVAPDYSTCTYTFVKQ